MVLLYKVDGKTSIYRNVVRGKNLQEHIEGFNVAMWEAREAYMRVHDKYEIKVKE